MTRGELQRALEAVTAERDALAVRVRLLEAQLLDRDVGSRTAAPPPPVRDVIVPVPTVKVEPAPKRVPVLAPTRAVPTVTVEGKLPRRVNSAA